MSIFLVTIYWLNIYLLIISILIITITAQLTTTTEGSWKIVKDIRIVQQRKLLPNKSSMSIPCPWCNRESATPSQNIFFDSAAIAGASSGISTVISNNNNQPSSSDTVGPAGSNQWHNYPNYKPISWDRYVSEINEKPSNVSSGVAASITIFVFFAVFILTFGCRLYSSRIEESQQQQANATRTSIGSTSGLAPFEQAWIHPDKRELPPCYEVAITMPTQIPHLETSNSNCDAINCAADRDALALRLTYSLGRPPPASPTGSNSDLSNNSTNNNNSQ